MTLESTIEAYLVKRVEALGGICLKGAIPGRRFLDRICIFPHGITVWVECKRPKYGRRERQQIYYITKLQDMGHEATFVENRQDVDGIIEWYLMMTESCNDRS